MFVRSRLTKVSFGIFVATFVYSIVTLIAIRSAHGRDRGFTPVLSTTGVALLVIATIVAFLLFANGTARLLRVQYLVERIADETRPALTIVFPTGRDSVDVGSSTTERGTGGDPCQCARRDRRGRRRRPRGGSPSAPAAGWRSLAPSGATSGAAPPSPWCTRVGTRSASDAAADVCDQFLLTNERSLLLDPGFGLRQLVDIAIRALSPAVNDPTTAVQVVDRVVDLLRQVIDRPSPTGWYVDDAGVARVRLPVDSFDELTALGFTEIIRYGADSPQVVRRLRAAFDELGSHGPRPGVIAMQDLLDAAADESSPRAFLAVSASPDPRGLG